MTNQHGRGILRAEFNRGHVVLGDKFDVHRSVPKELIVIPTQGNWIDTERMRKIHDCNFRLPLWSEYMTAVTEPLSAAPPREHNEKKTK